MTPHRIRSLMLFCLLAAASFSTISCKQESPELKPLVALKDFNFIERSGRHITLKDLQGKYWVANFFFSGCSIQCRQLSVRMAQLQELLKDNPSVSLISFSVDPETDTPEVLRNYAADFKAESNKWWFVTGDKLKLHQFIRDSFLLPAEENPNPGMIMADDFIHSEKFALVNNKGVVMGYFDGLDPKTPRQVKSLLDQLTKPRF